MHGARVLSPRIDNGRWTSRWIQELFRVLAELFAATLGAKVVRPSLVVVLPDGVSRVDRHPTHGIDDALDRFCGRVKVQDLTYWPGFASNFVLQIFAQK
jgi:hypothetical protein